MTTTLTAHGTLLTADLDTRTLRYRLLPFGEPGRTNLGTVTASAGQLELPDTPIRLNIEHDPKRPVARSASIVEDSSGIEAAFTVAKTRAGDDLLAEAAEGLRTGCSVEIEDPVIRAGALIGGRITGAAAVVAPAFPSAQLIATDTPLTQETTTVTAIASPPTITDPATASPTGLAATFTPETPASEGLDAVFKRLAAAHRDGGQGKLLAALSDIVPAHTVALEQPQWIGELWSGKAYQRRFVPLFNHANLTSYTVKGWRWVTKPEVGPYAGNKAAIPSNGILTEQQDIAADRIAGGHDIDRKHKDFSDPEFWRAYWAAMTESYARVSDVQVLADIIAAAGAPVTVGNVPAGVSRAMAMIVDGAIEILNGTDTMPTFAVVATGLWRDLMLTREEDRLAYLNAALGFEEGTLNQNTFRLMPAAALPAGRILMGARDAATVHELGEVPIRVEAEHVSNAGIDTGLFGYYAVNVHDDDGLVIVDDGV